MSIEVNSNNVNIKIQNIYYSENEIKNKNKEYKKKEEFEYKINQMKEKLKNLLKSTLGKNLLNLETKAKEHLQILTSTTKIYNDFNKKIKLLIKQVEDNKKRKEDNRSKIKKLKVHSSKIRSKTVQMGNRGKLNLSEPKSSVNIIKSRKINNDSNYKLTNENINSMKITRSKTVDPHESLFQNSAKKSNKNISLVFQSEKNFNSNSNNSIVKIKKYNSGKFYLTEQNCNQKKKLISEKNYKYNNNSKTKDNLSKSKKFINSTSNILTGSKEKSQNYKYLNKKAMNKKDSFKELRKSQDFSNKFIPKPKENFYNKKDIEIISEKKLNPNKKYIKNNKNESEKENENILKRLEKQREMLENMRKQREIINIKEEEKKKEKEKEKEEERIKEEKRKEKEKEDKIKLEERIKEEERSKDEERKKIQMNIEEEIEREKIEKENIRKEMEKQREEDNRQKELERQKEKERQKELENRKEIERQKEI